MAMTRLSMPKCLLLLLFAATWQGCNKAESSSNQSPSNNAPSNNAPSSGSSAEAPKLALNNQSAPFEKVLCSGQPSEAQFDALKAAGVTRVINLRAATEKGSGWEEERAKTDGIDFVRLTINGKDGLTRENVDTFAELLAKSTTGTTLVSCGSSNRVGAMFALKAFWIDKQSKEEALAIGERAGMKSLKPVVEQLLNQ